MKRSLKAGPRRRDDSALNWTMRVVGIVVFAASAFFLYRDITLNPAYDYFFAMTALLGFVTAAASWIRTEYEAPRWSGSARPQFEVVRERS